MANDNAAGDKGQNNNNESSLLQKGMSFDKLLTSLATKQDKQRAGEFQKKFEVKYKELDAAEAIVRNTKKELEKMFVEFNESL